MAYCLSILFRSSDWEEPFQWAAPGTGRCYLTDQVFVIYSRRDLNLVRALRHDLRESAYAPWIDIEELAPGVAVRSLLADGLASSAAALVIHSWEWIYDPRFVDDNLRLVVDIAHRLPTCPPIVALRADNAPIAAPLRTLVWVGLYEPPMTPDIGSAIHRAAQDRSYTASALAALTTLVTQHDESARRLRVHLRQHWAYSLDLMARGSYVELVNLWRPVFDIPSFRPNHPRWTDDEYTRCAIQGAKSLLFQACVALGQSEEFETYVPIAYTALCDIVSSEPFKADTYDELSELNAEAAMTQNLNYADVLKLALEWSNGWDPTVLTMFDIPAEESREVFNAAERRLEALWAMGAAEG
jgi:hypothetical protein